VELSPRLLDIARQTERLCPHFHVPLQSGSDRILRKMRRRYTAAEFLDTLERARGMLDRPAFSTDVIVGFPGETEEDFGRTRDVCSAAEFARMHIFPYSPRPGTDAATMSGQCPSRVVTARRKNLDALAQELAAAAAESVVGRTVRVLAETSRDKSGRLCGYTDRYLRASFDGPDDLMGTLVPVAVQSAGPGRLFGRVAENA
jgi:threonylcarbamoyladenosine tRNA methylthiotransferase MtaB